MGILKHDFCHQAALDELHRCQKFLRILKSPQELIEENKARQKGLTDQYSLFPQWGGLTFRNSQKQGAMPLNLCLKFKFPVLPDNNDC